LRGALRLGALRVGEFLVPRVRISAVDIDEPPDSALAVILASPFTRLPVYRETIDDIVGFIHTKDVARQAAEREGDIDVASLVRPVLVVPVSMKADQLLIRMREERRQFAIVLDEFGGTAGLVTIENVLEQVIGDIVDEFKAPAAAPEHLSDGRVRIPGDTHLDDLELLLGMVWEKGETHTIGGRVVEALGHVPLAGERVVINEVTFEVEAVADRAVTSVIAIVPDRRQDERDEEGQ
jgi:CBS domain containing-hemolysin-like protein